MQRALIVDDSPQERRMYRRILNSIGVESCSASDGLEALDLLQRERFDLVLVDQIMPGLRGLEVIRRMPEQVREHMVLITVSLESDLSLEASIAGVLALQKPIRTELIEFLLNDKMVSKGPLPEAVIARGVKPCPTELCRAFAERHGLSKRQREVIAALMDGKATRAQIADELKVSMKTIDAHLQAIFAKTGYGSQL